MQKKKIYKLVFSIYFVKTVTVKIIFDLFIIKPGSKLTATTQRVVDASSVVNKISFSLYLTISQLLYDAALYF